MTSERKFYRSVIQVEVLSEDPLGDGLTLTDLDNETTDGHCSGSITTVTNNEVVDGPTMAKLLKAQGSDPEFFQLTETGEDTEELDTE